MARLLLLRRYLLRPFRPIKLLTLHTVSIVAVLVFYTHFHELNALDGFAFEAWGMSLIISILLCRLIPDRRDHHSIPPRHRRCRE